MKTKAFMTDPAEIDRISRSLGPRPARPAKAPLSGPGRRIKVLDPLFWSVMPSVVFAPPQTVLWACSRLAGDFDPVCLERSGSDLPEA